jgi:predicted kinase
MPTLYAMSGISGSGKTYTRTHDPRLKDLFAIDIAQQYIDCPQISPDYAFCRFCDLIVNWMGSGKDFVIEAYFRKGSKQRTYLEFLCEVNGYDLEYIELSAPKEICIERVKKQLEAEPENEPYHVARLYLLSLPDDR